MASDPIFILTILAVAAVAIILLVGIGSFARGGEFNRKHSNRLMRWRIAAQAAAVVLILLVVYLRGGSSG